jgi:hypothetical protein
MPPAYGVNQSEVYQPFFRSLLRLAAIVKAAQANPKNPPINKPTKSMKPITLSKILINILAISINIKIN